MSKSIKIITSITHNNFVYIATMRGDDTDSGEDLDFWKSIGGVIFTSSTGVTREKALARCARQFGEELDERINSDEFVTCALDDN